MSESREQVTKRGVGSRESGVRRSPRCVRLAALLAVGSVLPLSAAEEFCLTGEADLGVRLQGTRPAAGETSPARWCVVTEAETERVRFFAEGRSNPDIEGSFTVAYLPPTTVRLVIGESPPDVEFRGALVTAEAAATRRIDPRRLVEELDARPEWIVARHADGRVDVRYPGAHSVATARIDSGRLRSLETRADLPLRGRVPVTWSWSWPLEDGEPSLDLTVDGQLLFRADATRRTLSAAEAEALWLPSGDLEPHEAPGKAWPARIEMRVETLAPGVHRVLHVRTGFHHLVVETEAGLVVADAPAGWVELHQIPPADLVPGLGVSGLAERFVDVLRSQFPQRPLRAVAITHFHDDHAGGARAFAAAGAEIYAPQEVAEFLERALARSDLPEDRLAASKGTIEVTAVGERLVLADAQRPVELLPIAPGPHVAAALGVWVPAARIFFQSDLHVPNADLDTPRPERAATECAFARWAVGALPEDAEVLNSHTLQSSSVARLRRYTESPGCRPAANGPRAEE